MNTNQFLVARYMSDLERRETRNIGIITWIDGNVRAKFLDVSDADFIEEPENYIRWIDYWQELCSQDRIQIFNNPAATKKSPRFLKALQKTQKGNYILEHGGDIFSAVSEKEIPRAFNFLYSRLVTRINEAAEGRTATLTDRCYDAFKRAGVSERQDFKRRYPLKLVVDGVEQDIHFDFGIGEQNPKALFNKVNPSKEDSVWIAAGKCETAIAKNVCKKEQCYSLFDSENEGFGDSVGILRMFSNPIDIADPATPEMLRKIADAA